ncbi:MAG: type II toxin-antitoxin system RelB/DinJ family antitoxin [Bifidobacteriaceae bacterium]|jgi:DNA-damage-inducible protein J|nr:type II toxin-antitoxin system RelB/DinJ family antitoxin [Bifidobacteriaceae bacterium]
MAATSLNIKVDAELKRRADSVFAALGLTTSAGINVYLKRVVATRGIPFALILAEDDEAEAMALTRKLSRRALNDAW